MPEWDRAFSEYGTGREQARIAVIKQIYTKYYRRKFADGNFRASWIPDSEKLKRLYDSGNAKAVEGDKCQLITINPHWLGCISTSVQFVIDVVEILCSRKNLIDDSVEFCIEQRGTEREVHGVHVHLWHGNEYGIAKSEIIRRVLQAMDKVKKSGPYGSVQWSRQSVDVRERPKSSCMSYIRKNKDCDAVWGLGFMGDGRQDMMTLSAKIACDRSSRAAQICARDEELRIERERVTNIQLGKRRRVDLVYEDGIPETP